jgi:hypothetical protein
LRPAFGNRIPAQILPGEIADWYDDLTEHGYTTQTTVQDLVVVGRCPRCGTHVDTVAEGSRRTATVACPTTGSAGSILCRWKGERRVPMVVKQHPPISGSTLGDIHATLRGAFRFGVQRGRLAMGENPMTFVERRADRHRLLTRRGPQARWARTGLVAGRLLVPVSMVAL